jgi:hypothetical protein
MLARSGFVVAAVLTAVLSVGCGPASFQKGDRLVVLEDMQASGESQWADGTMETFSCQLPKGAILSVLYKQATGADYVECEPVEIQRQTDEEFITNFVLPPHLKNRGGPTAYSLTIKMADIDTKLKRVEVAK